MPTLQLTLRCLERADCLADDDEGNRLSTMVRRAVERGRAPMAAVALREDRLDLISLAPVLAAKVPVQRFLAGLTRSTAEGAGGVDAVGVIGVVRTTQKGQSSVPMAMAFLEWPDGRWWHWRALIDPDGPGIMDLSETLNRAVDGDPLPHDFGRWWSLGRRSRVSVHLSRTELPEARQFDDDDATSDEPVVH